VARPATATFSASELLTRDLAAASQAAACAPRAGVNGSMDQWTTDAVDRRMMRRCIELSRIATTQGEFPFAVLICAGDDP
jgi:hypothetical protein